MSKVGELLGEAYRILEVLSGGMADVYICEFVERAGSSESPSGGRRRIALKTFQQRYFFDQGVRLSFIREASTWLRLSGLPHILPVLSVEQIGDRPFLLMIAAERGPEGERSIADLLRSGPIAPNLTLRYALQLAIGLRAAGQQFAGLVHGDLKPANILLINGDGFLADFGLVSAVSLGRADHRLQSTWAYCAPELWDARPTPSVASDVYAFGTLLFEMLCGHTPFVEQGRDRSTWEKAHRTLTPVTPAIQSGGPMTADVLDLALACLVKRPEERPVDFAAIVDRLDSIYKEHDPVDHLMVLMRAHELKQNTGAQMAAFLESRIAGLLGIDEPAQALEELDRVPQDRYTPGLWLQRGTTLSLLNRDTEALESFERAQRAGLSPDDDVRCEVEYALSLKRVGRFQEAESIYERLLISVSDEQLPLVIINLATVYLQQKRGSETVRLLEPFVRRNPDSALAWANLGQAYVFERRYQDAERAYGRALVAAPQEGRVRTMLAALYMDHLGRIEDAWAALDAAFDSGFEGRDWLVRMLTCSVLLNKKDSIDGLMYGLTHNFKKESADSMIAEAKEMVQSLIEKYKERPAASQSDQPATTENDSVETAQEQAHTSANEAEESATPDHQSAKGTHDQPPASEEPTKARIPFLNLRFYDTLDFTLDFYDDPASPTFRNSFVGEWRRAVRDPRIAVGGVSLRGSPFYFTRCPNCGVYVLTNRDVGYRISCRMCDTRWQTDPTTGSVFEPLLRDISSIVGIREQPPVPMVFALWVQPSENVSLDQIAAICTEGRFERWGNSTLLSIHLLQQAIKSGARLERPWGMWALETIPAGSWAHGTTPREVASVVRKIQRFDPQARTISTELPAEQARSMRTTAEEVEAETEELVRQKIRAGLGTAADYRAIANVLSHRREHAEAERYARAAVAADAQSAEMWECLGLVLYKRDDFSGAREALEGAIALDGRRVLALEALAACYIQLGDNARAREIRSRANSISGGAFQG